MLAELSFHNKTNAQLGVSIYVQSQITAFPNRKLHFQIVKKRLEEKSEGNFPQINFQNQNLGASRPKSTLQGSALDKSQLLPLVSQENRREIAERNRKLLFFEFLAVETAMTSPRCPNFQK